MFVAALLVSHFHLLSFWMLIRCIPSVFLQFSSKNSQRFQQQKRENIVPIIINDTLVVQAKAARCHSSSGSVWPNRLTCFSMSVTAQHFVFIFFIFFYFSRTQIESLPCVMLRFSEKSRAGARHIITLDQSDPHITIFPALFFILWLALRHIY